MADVTRKLGRSPSIRDGGAVREVLDRIGDKWSLLVIGTLRSGPMRFGELEQAVAGISQRMLTLTLKLLDVIPREYGRGSWRRWVWSRRLRAVGGVGGLVCDGTVRMGGLEGDLPVRL